MHGSDERLAHRRTSLRTLTRAVKGSMRRGRIGSAAVKAVLLAAVALAAVVLPPPAAAAAAGAAVSDAGGAAETPQDAGGGAAAALTGDSAVIPEAGDSMATLKTADTTYQEEVLERCRGVWPERFRHGYAHFAGPMIEEFFFTWWGRRKPPLPQVYLPIGWSTYFFGAARVQPFNLTEVARAKEQIERVLAGLDRQRSYFSVVHFAGLLAKEQIAIPCDLKLTLFVGGGPEDSLWAPHVTYVPIPLLLKVLKPARKPRKKMVSFAGGFLFWQDPGGLRSEMRTMFQNLSGYHIHDRDPFWERMMHTSVFHLCPRGNGPSSYRLYEALQADTIPIYIWDEIKWLAFEDVVDWDSIAIVVHRSEMASIPERVNATDAAAKRADVGRLRGMWRYNHTSAYIVSRVAASAKTGAIAGYRGNGTAAWCNPADGDGTPAAGVDAVILPASVEPAAAADDADLAEKRMAVDSVAATHQGGGGGGSGGGNAGSGSSTGGTGAAGSSMQQAAADANLLGMLDTGGDPDDDLPDGGAAGEARVSRPLHQGSSGPSLGGTLAVGLPLLLVLYIGSRAAQRRQRRQHGRRSTL